MAFDNERGLDELFGGKKFVDPFLVRSNLFLPKDWFNALEFAMYLSIKFPLYTQAARRTVSHFITDIQFDGDAGDMREREDMKGYLIDELELFEALQLAGMELMIYGNSFARIHYPFDRYLVDRRNGGYRLYSVNAFNPDDMHYSVGNMTYNVPDPTKRHIAGDNSRVDLEFTDRPSHDPSRIKLRFLDPKRMLINMNFVSGTKEFIWRFDEFFKSDIKGGQKIYQINETPADMLRAIKNDQDFVFDPGSIFHFANPYLTGLSNNGWGIPNILLNYNNIHQLQVYRCINEAVGQDYILPFRLISPAASGNGGGADAAASTNLGKWQAAMTQLIAKKRVDPTALFTVPFPVTYQELGSNGKALAPVELIKQQEDSMLDAFGLPAELAHGTLQYQQVPNAIRTFQNTFLHIPRGFNRFTKWVVKNICDYLEREQLAVTLQLPTVADDMENKQIGLQLAAGGEISRETAYRPFNINNPVQENIRRAKEDMEIQEAKQKEQEKFERKMTLGSANQVVDAMVQAQGGSAPAGGGAPPLQGGAPMPPPPNGGQAVTPLDIEQQGEEMAQQLLQIPDNGERRKQMNQIKASNPVLYAVVQRKMEDMRQQGASEGRKAVSQPQQ